VPIRAEAETQAAIDSRQQVTKAMMQAAFLQAERGTALASRDTIQAARDAAERELAAWTTGGFPARARRGFWRGRV
jgi:hypothetical protein